MIIPLWFVLAVIAGLFSVAYNAVLRQILKDGDPLAYGWWFELMRALAFLAIALFDFRFDFSWHNLALLIGLGLLETVSIYFYTKMHAFNELSISAIVSRLRVIWIPIIALIFLGERLMGYEYIGILLIFLGLLSIVTPKSLKLDAGLKYALISSVVVAFVSPGIKVATSFASTPVIMFFFSFPSVVLIPLLMKSPGERLSVSLRNETGKQLLIIVANVANMYLLAAALALGQVGVVAAVYQSMSVVSVLIGIVLMRERGDIVKKLVGAGLALGGSLMLLM